MSKDNNEIVPQAYIDSSNQKIKAKRKKTLEEIEIDRLMEGPHKRFLIFSICAFSACGGLGDIEKDFDTILEVVNYCSLKKENRHEIIIIYDRIKGVEIDIEDINVKQHLR